jgi:hypothetical protein
MKKWWLLCAALALAGIALWWDNGLQGWFAIQTGTRCGTTGPQYCYWSGFGSVWPWSVFVLAPLITGGILLWRHHTCAHSWWCWRRPDHQVGDTTHFICAHHHPDITPTTAKEAVAKLNGDSP